MATSVTDVIERTDADAPERAAEARNDWMPLSFAASAARSGASASVRSMTSVTEVAISTSSPSAGSG